MNPTSETDNPEDLISLMYEFHGGSICVAMVYMFDISCINRRVAFLNKNLVALSKFIWIDYSNNMRYELTKSEKDKTIFFIRVYQSSE